MRTIRQFYNSDMFMAIQIGIFIGLLFSVALLVMEHR